MIGFFKEEGNIIKRQKEALKTFNNGFNCCQSVISVFNNELGLNKDTALKISSGFGGGLTKGEVCGAVSGAIMVLGLKYGHFIEEEIDSKAKMKTYTKEFIRRFEEKNNSIICKKLLGYDLSSEKEYLIIKDKELFDRLCPKYIEDSIEILEEMLKVN